VLDVVFNEDQSRARSGHALENLATQVPQFAEADFVFMRVPGRRRRFFCTTFARLRQSCPVAGRRGFGCAWGAPSRDG
jgi:hypothetical protein